jgi:HCOMODA/2-hydroxy-3-carboxy-muconic semialdehyde decarboxylase
MPKDNFNADLATELTTANRILFDQGVLDAFGHVSVRDDFDKNHFLLARNMAPGLVTPEDIMAYDLEGAAIDPRDRRSYLERFIHASIYKMYPDVKAVVHSHSPSILPFGTTALILKPIYHMGSFLGTGAPVFEIRDAGGPATDMLITNNELGAALARKLGKSPVVLMRGHGNVVIGDSLKQVVFRAVYTEVNARVAAQALLLGQGKATFLNEQEAAHSAVTNNSQSGRAWDLWALRVKEKTAA